MLEYSTFKRLDTIKIWVHLMETFVHFIVDIVFFLSILARHDVSTQTIYRVSWMLNACQQMARQGRKRSQFIWYFFHDIRINKNTNSFSEQVRPDRRTCVLNLTWRVSGGFGHRTFRKRFKKASDGSFHPGLFFGLLECSFTIWRLTYFFSDLISGFLIKIESQWDGVLAISRNIWHAS